MNAESLLKEMNEKEKNKKELKQKDQHEKSTRENVLWMCCYSFTYSVLLLSFFFHQIEFFSFVYGWLTIKDKHDGKETYVRCFSSIFVSSRAFLLCSPSLCLTLFRFYLK